MYNIFVSYSPECKRQHKKAFIAWIALYSWYMFHFVIFKIAIMLQLEKPWIYVFIGKLIGKEAKIFIIAKINPIAKINYFSPMLLMLSLKCTGSWEVPFGLFLSQLKQGAGRLYYWFHKDRKMSFLRTSPSRKYQWPSKPILMEEGHRVGTAED